MNKPDVVWILVADTQHARLLCGTRTGHGHLHLDEVAKTSTTFVAHPHKRPTRTGSGGGTGDVGHAQEEKLAHFARELSDWLAKEIGARNITTCDLFAPTHVLGGLRQVIKKPIAARLREHAGELAQLTLADLTRHPRIAALMEQ